MLASAKTRACSGAGGRMPTARAAHEALVTALADQASWAARTTAAKELLAAMLASRRSAADLAKQYDIRCREIHASLGGILKQRPVCKHLCC
jgi:hypothetical protein